MPTFRVPWRSGEHRNAAIALYRTLLGQCRIAPLPKRHKGELSNIVRNRFKYSQRVSSPKRLKLSFQAGYEAVDVLDAAVAGDEDSRLYICKLLEIAPAIDKTSSPRSEPSRTKTIQDPRASASAAPVDKFAERSRPSLLDRPLPLEQLSGKRHVPVLFNANSIPVLRIKKPQPSTLSAYLNTRIKRRQWWHDRRYRLQDQALFAKMEDMWDEDMATQIHDGLPGSASLDEPTWQYALATAYAQVQKLLQDEREKNHLMARQMQAVVDREQALYDQEKAARLKDKRDAWLTKKKNKTSSMGPSTG